MTGRVESVASIRAIGPLVGGKETAASRIGESELIKRAAEGDKDAYREVVERYQRRLFLTAFEVLRNREDAEDVVQEALARSFFSLKSFRGGSSLSSWLQRIVINLSIDLKRRVRRRGGEACSFEDGVTVASDGRTEGGHANPESLLRQKEHRERMLRVLEDLSADHRQAIILREFEGLSYDDIARLTGVSAGTVMSRLFYARKKLQSALAELR